MLYTRVIPRLDLKGENLVKGIHLEGLRIIGKPEEYALKYDKEGADELIIIDTVASLYGRENLINIIKKIASEVFIPITAGGGIRKAEDIYNLLEVGVDKVCLNTAAVNNPDIVKEVSRIFGKQCVVLSIEAASTGKNKWEAFTDNAREATGLDAVEWAKKMEDYGVGEILVTSIDCDGTRKGFDIELIKAVCDVVSIPVVASGGAGNIQHTLDVIKKTNCHAVSMASLFHYGLSTISAVKKEMDLAGINVRRPVLT